ncbi:uncharacterized protein LOC62_03G005125 [Vanrija pseudolonga]|uniref:Uncharacterized protein n=1 Tax=Vanrija pseudolonga TaxID=143232 RepID=A0AAF0Y7F9_9TREE|nr:hypothetical protein LOC62_03G005125 [Vanrija pseudolonga]
MTLTSAMSIFRAHTLSVPATASLLHTSLLVLSSGLAFGSIICAGSTLGNWYWANEGVQVAVIVWASLLLAFTAVVLNTRYFRCEHCRTPAYAKTGVEVAVQGVLVAYGLSVATCITALRTWREGPTHILTWISALLLTAALVFETLFTLSRRQPLPAPSAWGQTLRELETAQGVWLEVRSEAGSAGEEAEPRGVWVAEGHGGVGSDKGSEEAAEV